MLRRTVVASHIAILAAALCFISCLTFSESLDVEAVIQNRLLPAVDEIALVSLDGLEAEVAHAASSSVTLADQYANLQRLLRVKEVQLEDARSVALSIDKKHKDTVETVQKLRQVLEKSHSGSDKLANELKSELREESELKKHLAQDEQRIKGLQETLENTRLKALDPSLSKWVERRVESVGSAVDSPDTGRMLGAAVGSVVETAKDTVGSIEESAARRGGPALLAGLLSLAVVLTPGFAAAWAVGRLTRSISYRQHLVVGHIVNIFFLFACAALTTLTGYDPLVAMHHSSPQHALVLMLFFCVQWPIMLAMMLYTAYVTKSPNERQVFIAQAFLYMVVFFHVLKHTYPRILFGQPAFSLLSSNLKNYILYLVSASSMLLITISAAETNSEGLVGDMQTIFGDGSGSTPHKFENGSSANLPLSDLPHSTSDTAGVRSPIESKARFSRAAFPFGILGNFYKAE